jgi:UDP-N-acetylglucosamine acyltransferase
MIHPTAVIHPRARLDPTVVVGPYAVVDEDVTIGAHCTLGPHVYLSGRTTIGTHNQFHAGCVVGNVPQDLKYKGGLTRLRIGDHNLIREHVTVHGSNTPEGETVIGSHNLLMHHSHVAHNVEIGNHAILAGGAMLAGHVTVGDRAVISGNGLVHQFVRVGTLAMMQGGSAISQDLPPFCVAHQVNELVGLNIVGMRRAGFTSAERLEIKKLYHLLLRGSGLMRERIEKAREEFSSERARLFMEFLTSSQRGICSGPGHSHDADESEDEDQ